MAPGEGAVPGRLDRRQLQRLLKEVIAAGPPGEEAYGLENLGRYVHTLAWITGSAGPIGGTLLDAGIYPGHMVLALARVAYTEIAGVGRFVPPAFQRWMAERGIAVRDVDVERELLPFAPASFDRVLATEILEHLASPALFLSECRRVLRPGGVLYLTTPNVVDLRGRAWAIRGRSPQSHLFGITRPLRMNEWVHRREYAPDEVSRLLGAVGFQVGQLHTWTPTRADGGRGAGAWLAPLVNRLPGLGGTIFATASPLAEPGAAGATDRARLAPGTPYLETGPGASATLTASITNLGTATWDPASTPGRVGLGAHLLDPDGRLLDRDLARGPLPHPVGPGEEVATELTLRAPAEPGVFLVELDLVREGEHWFGDDGSPTARVVLRVVG
jgi:SAM-dependent methyltransferase